MGANFRTMSLPDSLTRTQVREAFRQAQDQDAHENGHSYSGGFAMAEGLTFTERHFGTFDAAVTYLEETAEKWADALCVSVMDDRATFAGLMTTDPITRKLVEAPNPDHGKVVWLIGAYCAS